jgi:hypothetical protein
MSKASSGRLVAGRSCWSLVELQRREARFHEPLGNSERVRFEFRAGSDSNYEWGQIRITGGVRFELRRREGRPCRRAVRNSSLTPWRLGSESLKAVSWCYVLQGGNGDNLGTLPDAKGSDSNCARALARPERRVGNSNLTPVPAHSTSAVRSAVAATALVARDYMVELIAVLSAGRTRSISANETAPTESLNQPVSSATPNAWNGTTAKPAASSR